MILGKSALLHLIEEGVIGIEPFDPSNVGPMSVDLTLGNVFRVFEGGVLDIEGEELDMTRYGKLVTINDDEFLELKPGEMVLGITKEIISLPPNIGGILSGRSRFARAGLMVHVSSNLVQPGSRNRQVLEIINMGPFTLKLRPGIKICQIMFFEVKDGDMERGRYVHQLSP